MRRTCLQGLGQGVTNKSHTRQRLLELHPRRYTRSATHNPTTSKAFTAIPLQLEALAAPQAKRYVYSRMELGTVLVESTPVDELPARLPQAWFVCTCTVCIGQKSSVSNSPDISSLITSSFLNSAIRASHAVESHSKVKGFQNRWHTRSTRVE